MTRGPFGQLMDRLRTTGWWPVHYAVGAASWWSWRGRYYRVVGSEDD